MKRINFLISIIVAILLLIPAFSASADASPVIIVESVTAERGQNVTINVDFLNNPGINTYTLSIEYDTTRLSLKSVSGNKSLGGSFIYVNNAVWFSNSDTDYSGTFLTLEFSVLDAAAPGDANVTVSYRSGQIVNYKEELIDFEIVPGKVTVKSKLLIGDVDKDGAITLRDISALKTYISGMMDLSEINSKNSDVDYDGVVTLKDISALKALIAG